MGKLLSYPGPICRGTRYPGSNFELHKLAPAHPSFWQANFFFSLDCQPSCLPLCKVWSAQSSYFLRHSLPDYLYCLLSVCLTYLQCLQEHQGPSWTTVNMPPQQFMQVGLARSSDVNLTLSTENFIKEYVSQILLLWNILTGAIGRILHQSEP